MEKGGTLKGDPQKKEREPLKKAKEKLDEIAPKELEKGSNLKWEHPKERNGVDRNTEQWVNDQKSFGKEKGKI